MSFLTVSAIVPPATVLPFAASTAPDGWLICDGRTVSRTTYSALFASIGTSYGSGDGATTFNLPDFRWTFLRGYGPDITVTGTGTASSNQATFTAHGFNRTGVKVRLTSGTLSGLALSTDYWVIVVDANTLAFATSKANAIANTRVAISGANSAVIEQWEAPDSGTRESNTNGAASGANVGSYEGDAFQSHRHFVQPRNQGGGGATGYGDKSTTPTTLTTFGPEPDPGFGSPRFSSETRPTNISVNYIIKF